MPGQSRLWMCHDYKAPNRDTYAWQSTVAEQRAHNPHVKDGKTEEEFVAFRQRRDATLAAPTLLLPSIQVPIRAGRFPHPMNGVTFRAYVEQHLAPTLSPGDIVVCDNLQCHKSSGVRATIEARGAQLRFLPPYSPDMNPIEQAFAKLKALIRTRDCTMRRG